MNGPLRQYQDNFNTNSMYLKSSSRQLQDYFNITLRPLKNSFMSTLRLQKDFFKPIPRPLQDCCRNM